MEIYSKNYDFLKDLSAKKIKTSIRKNRYVKQIGLFIYSKTYGKYKK